MKFPAARIVEASQERTVLDLDVAAELDAFRGHFPDHPILPGVTQIDWVVHLAGLHLGLGEFPARDFQVKFRNIIHPGTVITLLLELDRARNRLSFTYRHKEDIMSSGTIKLGDYGMKACAIVPSHNHHKVIGAIVKRLRESGLPVFIIDDGSAEPARLTLAALHDETSQVIVCRFDTNRGKGIAVSEGFRMAIEAGFTHVVQVDADGQHDLNVLPQMLALAETYPEALISGQPFYDDSIPTGRKIGRWITHVWVWIETLSLRITDSMCGFRVYPLDAVRKLLAERAVGSHMEFDTDIMVRLFWQGVAPVMVPVKVIYPPDNSSNFDLLRDNWRITKAHTRLVLTMLARLPSILGHRPPRTDTSQRWATLGERGAYWGLRFCMGVYSLLGKQGCRIIMAPIVFYFYLTGVRQRRASQQFLTRALGRPSTSMEGYRHFMNFFTRALDVFIAWTGGISPNIIVPTDPQGMADFVNDPRGGLIVVAHLGNVNVAHALLPPEQRARITVLAHTHHAVNYNRVLKDFCPQASLNILQVTEIGPATIIDLKQRVESGGRIVIAGDRTSVLSAEHAVLVPFFGSEAPFPHGPWVLGSLLDCPVYLLFCLQDGGCYRLTMERFAERVELPRATREASLRAVASRYAARLEHFAAAAPFQWYNFFDFWAR